ncbi:MAG TPA: RNase H family protein [Acidimicrobiales bacterium]|nr:RNase H family protein [Acidimicrobiales bacterium]
MTTVVYTDGACVGNPGPGGWAWAVPGGQYASGADAATTNQRMEVKAALEAVTTLEGPLEVVSDSTYVVNCFRDRWWEGWLARGWINKAKKPVANRDLWEPLIDAVRADLQRVKFRWVKGHGTDPFNDLVDRLAVDAARTQAGRAGTGDPGDLGPPDVPGARGAIDSQAPTGHRMIVAGHRPPALGGYDSNPVADKVRSKLVEVVKAKQVLHPDLVVLTGLGLGAEQLGAEAAAEAKVPYVAVLPYPDPDSVWPEASRRRHRELVDGARAEVVLQSKPPATKQLAGAALSRRDAWLARNANEALVVWDGQDAAVGRLVRSLNDALGEDNVWVIEPAPGG